MSIPAVAAAEHQQQQAAEEVRQAILALYRGTDPASQQAANAFLLAFAERGEAWALSLALLEQGAAAVEQPQQEDAYPPEVLYFAANVLYTKAGRDWGQLLASLQGQGGAAAADAAAALLSTRLLAFLRAYLAGEQRGAGPHAGLSQGARLVVSRIGLALTAVALRDADPSAGVGRLLGEVFALLGGEAAGVRAAAPAAVAAGLGVIQALPEEAERADMGKGKRDALQRALCAATPQILAVAEALLAGRPELAAAALRALEGWLGLSVPSQQGDGGQEQQRTLTLSVLAERSPGLLERLVAVVGLQQPPPQQRSADLLCAAARLLGRLVTTPETPAYSLPPSRAPAALRILEALLAGLPAVVLASPPAYGEEAAHALAACFIEAATEECEALLAGSQAHGPPVAEAVLALTAHREGTHVATLALDFWAALAEVPLDERVPDLGGPLYARLTTLLAERLAYPPGFVCWDEEAELEAEEFVVGYREGELMKEMLEGCVGVLRAQYVEQLVHGGVAPLLAGQPGADWRRAEVALLMLQQAGKAFLAQLKGQQPDSPEAAAARLLLQTLHGALASPPFQAAHPLLLRALLRCLAAYQSLFLPPGRLPSKAPSAGVDEEGARALHRLALQCIVLKGLASSGLEPPLGSGGSGREGQPQSQQQRQPGAAALAFRTICVGALPSGLVASDPECLPLAMNALEAASAGGLPIPDRLAVAEAAVRTLLAVPFTTPPGAAAALRSLLAGLTQPVLLRLAAALGEAERAPNLQALAAVAEGLELVGQVVRFLDQAPASSSSPTPPPTAADAGAGRGGQHQHGQEEEHLALPLVAELWPLLERAAGVVEQGGARGGRGGADDPYRAVLTQLFQVQRHLVVGLAPLVAPRLPALLSLAARLYAGTLHEGALEAAGAAVEIFSSRPGTTAASEEDGCFAALLTATAGPTFAHLRAGVGPQECPQLVAAFYGMLLRFLEFRPGVLYPSPELPTALDLALACLEARAAQHEATRAVLLFLRDLTKRAKDAASVTAPQQEQAALATTLLPLLEARAPALIRLSLAALAGQTLSTLWANHLEFCFAFLQAWPLLAARTGGGGADAAVARLGEWVCAAVSDPYVLPAPAFGPEDRELLVGLIGRVGVGPESAKPRLKLLLDDVRRIAGGECEAEALRSHLVA